VTVDGRPVASWNQARWALLDLLSAGGSAGIEVETADGARTVRELALPGGTDAGSEDPLAAAGLELTAPQPVVRGVMDGGAGAEAGLRAGDRIVAADGQHEPDASSLLRIIQDHAGRPLTLGLLAVIVVISIWTPLTQAGIAQRWFSLPNLIWFAPVPLLVAACGWTLLRQLGGAPHGGPFVLSLCLVFLGYSGLGISLWPAIVPPHISIWDASAPPQSQGFALVGALLIIPVILMYTAWSYYVFRGKVRAGEGYH